MLLTKRRRQACNAWKAHVAASVNAADTSFCKTPRAFLQASGGNRLYASWSPTTCHLQRPAGRGARTVERQRLDRPASAFRHHPPIGVAQLEARSKIVLNPSSPPLPYPPLSPQYKTMPVVVDTIQPLSTATTVALSSNPSQQDIDSTTSTQLDHAVAKKVAADRARETSASAAVLGGCMPESHYLNGQDKMVQFAGLYVVRGPTESKHVRYTMDVAVADLQLRGRCIQRFQSFFLLRKRLLEVLKTCRGRLPSRKSTLIGDEDGPQISAGAELVELLTRPRCIQCPECEAAYDQLAAVKFPRRTLFPPSLQDIQERSQMLETFLDYCVRIATTWPACQRSKRLFIAALGKFLGVDLKEHLANHKEVGSVSEARTVNNRDEGEEEDSEKTESSSKVVYLPSPHEVSERVHSSDSDDIEDDRQSEPNFSFISNPSKENEGEGMVRSQSHC